MKQILSSIYMEESKNNEIKIEIPFFEQLYFFHSKALNLFSAVQCLLLRNCNTFTKERKFSKSLKLPFF